MKHIAFGILGVLALAGWILAFTQGFENKVVFATASILSAVFALLAIVTKKETSSE